MVKYFILILCLLAMPIIGLAQHGVGTLVNFQCGYVNPSGNIHSCPKSPVDPPTVYLEDYTLTFEADHPEYILYIKDEDDAVVYSTVVTSATTEVVLPSTLSGDYEIELIMGDWLFSGWIEL